MNEPRSVDGVLVRWGDRLFYPGNPRTPAALGRSPTGAGIRDRASVIRRRIESAARRAPQVMVKATGGAVAAWPPSRRRPGIVSPEWTDLNVARTGCGPRASHG